MIKRILMLLLLLWSGSLAVHAQDLEAPADTLLAQPADSLALANDSVPEKKAGLDAPVTYQATDSMVMTAGFSSLPSTRTGRSVWPQSAEYQCMVVQPPSLSLTPSVRLDGCH